MNILVSVSSPWAAYETSFPWKVYPNNQNVKPWVLCTASGFHRPEIYRAFLHISPVYFFSLSRLTSKYSLSPVYRGRN